MATYIVQFLAFSRFVGMETNDCDHDRQRVGNLPTNLNNAKNTTRNSKTTNIGKLSIGKVVTIDIISELLIIYLL